MPGITGLISKISTGDEKRKIDDMLGCMLHEPFYTFGDFQSQEHGFFVGYSSMPGSFSDCMPIWNEKKDLVLFLTGECYSDQPEIDTLANRGHKFNKHNASYLVHLYEEKKEAFFKTLNGWYNGIILDLRNSTATLFNDRYGIRRIYYYENDKYFAFSSEAKSLLKVFPELREISFQGIGEFLAYDCVLENRTYFRNIELLPPSSKWRIQKGNIRKETYLDMDEIENQVPLEYDSFINELESTFKRILPRYFAGGPIGLSLTGGLDTRAILACVNPAPDQLPCYTFSGSYRDIWDVRLAPKVAAACGQSHEILRQRDEDLLNKYSSEVEKNTYISDGLSSTDKVDVIGFNKMAREIAPVRMTGKYGSQVLKGIFGFKARPPCMDVIDEQFIKYIAAGKDIAQGAQKVHNLTFLLQNAIPWWWNSFVALESTQVDVRSPFLDNDFIDVLYRAPSFQSEFGSKFELDLISKTKPELMKIPTTGFYGGKGPWPLPAIRKMTINALLIIDKIYIREELPLNMTHLFGRFDALFISPLRLDRMVMGFSDYRRYRTWFRDQLSEYLREILLDQKTLNRPYWDKTRLVKIVNDHIKGRGTYLREIRKILQVELIHRVLLENI